jgi:hypothetical protein
MGSTIRRATLRMLFVAGLAAAAVGISGPAMAGGYSPGSSYSTGGSYGTSVGYTPGTPTQLCGYIYGISDGSRCIEGPRLVCGYIYGVSDGTKCIYIAPGDHGYGRGGRYGG